MVQGKHTQQQCKQYHFDHVSKLMLASSSKHSCTEKHSVSAVCTFASGPFDVTSITSVGFDQGSKKANEEVHLK